MRLVHAPEKLSSVVSRNIRPPRSHDPREFRQPHERIGKVFEHVAAGDAVERIVGKGQGRQVGGDVNRLASLESIASAAEHRLREIDAGDLRAADRRT